MGRVNTRVPQGFALGLLLFSIYLNDLFYLSECTKVCNFADDTTFYAYDKDLNSLINRFVVNDHEVYWLFGNVQQTERNCWHTQN